MKSLLSFLKRLIFLVSLVSYSSTAQVDTATEPHVPLTEHQKYLEQTTVNFTDVDLSGDPSIAAALVIDTITADMKETGRFTQLFEKATTPECRALIAEHYGYFMKAIATETPLPFASTKFDSSCEDEQPWDVNNLPKGIYLKIFDGFINSIMVL